MDTCNVREKLHAQLGALDKDTEDDESHDHLNIARQSIGTIRRWLDSYIESVQADNHIMFDTQRNTINYICDSVLSAMYIYRYVTAFNQHGFSDVRT